MNSTRKLVRWEVIMAALTLVVYAVRLRSGGSPEEAFAIAFIAALVLIGASIARVNTDADSAIAVVSATFAALTALIATFGTLLATVVAILIVANALVLSAASFVLRTRWRWALLSLLVEAAVVWSAIVYGSRLFGLK